MIVGLIWAEPTRRAAGHVPGYAQPWDEAR